VLDGHEWLFLAVSLAAHEVNRPVALLPVPVGPVYLVRDGLIEPVFGLPALARAVEVDGSLLSRSERRRETDDVSDAGDPLAGPYRKATIS
jgi:hypothetical protein